MPRVDSTVGSSRCKTPSAELGVAIDEFGHRFGDASVPALQGRLSREADDTPARGERPAPDVYPSGTVST
jgi:hypothetical protein